MAAQPLAFQKVLDSLLADSRGFPRQYLQEFSDIGPAELRSLQDVWPRVELKRKLALLDDLDALAETDTLVSFDDFASSLLTDPDPQVRTRAIRLLDESEDVKLVPSFLDMLNNDPDLYVRAHAAAALHLFVDLGELEEIPEPIHRQVEDTLLFSITGDDDARVRRAALESLGYSSREEVAGLIQSSFQREDPHWQASALTAMGRSADDHWADEVTRSLVHENDHIRRAAVQAAGELSLLSARQLLLRMLNEEDEGSLLSAVIWSLSQIGGEDVRTYLENILDQTEDEGQMAFLEEALDNLAFTEDLNRFDLFSFDPEDDLVEPDPEDDEE